MEQNEKEKVVSDFMQMLTISWTYEKLTKVERYDLAQSIDWAVSQDVLKGTYKQRWMILQAIYHGFLGALGYNRDTVHWREEYGNKNH